MRPITLCLVLFMTIGGAEAGTLCHNGRCFSCEGSATCTNAGCTCNGAPIRPDKLFPQNGPCGEEETRVHENGGGRVAITASVERSVHVSSDSVVCGRAIVTGETRLLNASVVNDRVSISGETTLDGAVVNGSTSVADSWITNSTVNGNVKVSHSQIESSTINGDAIVERSTVGESVINGSARLIGRQIHGAVLIQ